MFSYLRTIARHVGYFLSDERGATIAEYVLLVGFIAVMIIVVVIGFRSMIGGALTDAGQQLQNFK